jgi:hypothetical protein
VENIVTAVDVYKNCMWCIKEQQVVHIGTADGAYRNRRWWI